MKRGFGHVVHELNINAGGTHRRRIKMEEKAKVVSSVWGEEFTQFLAALTALPRTILSNRMNCFIG